MNIGEISINDAKQVENLRETLCKDIPLNCKNVIEITTMHFKRLIQILVDMEKYELIDNKLFVKTEEWIKQYTDEEIEEMAYISSIKYLKLCLESNAKQSLTSFRLDPFGLSPKSKKMFNGGRNINGKVISAGDSIYESYFRRKTVLMKNYTLRDFQKNKETSKENISLKDIKKESKPKKFKFNNLSFPQLAFVDMYHNGYLEIVDHILIYKKPLEKTLSNSSSDSLPIAYDRLNDMLDAMKEFRDSRKFVAYCFQLCELESTYRFILAARIAEYMVKNRMPKDTDLPYILHAIICRMKYTNNDNVESIDNSYVFYKYDDIIKRAFLVDERIKDNYITINDARQKFDKLYRGREMTYLAVTLYSKMFPISEHPKWGPVDFDLLESFFKRDFKIFERFEKVKPKNKTNTETDYHRIYDYIRELYSNEYFVDQDALSFVRENSQKYKKTSRTYARNKSSVADNKSSDE